MWRDRIVSECMLNYKSRHMAGAFSGGSGGIDTPRAPVASS